MNFGQRFVDTLKRIHYPDADKLNPASFDWMIENKKLQPFLESFCSSISEENVITDDELKEYEALKADKTVDIDALDKMAELEEKGISDEELQEQLEDLKVDIANAEKYIRLLEHQKDSLNVHKLALMQELETEEASAQFHMREKQRLEEKILPAAISELKETFDLGLECIQELHDILKETPKSREGPVPNALLLQDLKPYLDSEKEIVDNITNFLNNDFSKFMAMAANQKVDESLRDFIPEVSLEESQQQKIAEALRLKKVIQMAEEKYVDIMLEATKLESHIKFCEDLTEKGGLTNVCNLTDAQLRARREKAEKTVKELQKEQKRLREEFTRVVNNRLQTNVDKVINLCYEEKQKYFEMYLKGLEKPFEILLKQRARLELLNISLSIEEHDMKNTLNKVKTFREMLEAEVSEMERQEKLLEERSKEKTVDQQYVEEGSLLYAVNEVLCSESDPELAYLTPEDVYQKFEKRKEEEQNLIQESQKLLQDQLECISAAERSMETLEECVYGKKSGDANHPANLLEDLNLRLNKLGARIQNLEEKFLKEMTHYYRKKKLIETNSNLSKARRLFVYALTNHEKLRHCINEIKVQEEYLHRNQRL